MTKILTLKSTTKIWDYLKKECEENKKIRDMKILNLIGQFELQRMKKFMAIKKYLKKLLGIVRKIKLLGKKIFNSILVEKILIIVSERYKISITLLKT